MAQWRLAAVRFSVDGEGHVEADMGETWLNAIDDDWDERSLDPPGT